MQHVKVKAPRNSEEKRKYSPPKILDLGKLKDLTQGALSTRNDPGGAVGGKS